VTHVSISQELEVTPLLHTCELLPPNYPRRCKIAKKFLRFHEGNQLL